MGTRGLVVGREQVFESNDVTHPTCDVCSRPILLSVTDVPLRQATEAAVGKEQRPADRMESGMFILLN